MCVGGGVAVIDEIILEGTACGGGLGVAVIDETTLEGAALD